MNKQLCCSMLGVLFLVLASTQSSAQSSAQSAYEAEIRSRRSRAINDAIERNEARSVFDKMVAAAPRNSLKCTVLQQDGLPAEKVELLLRGGASDKEWKKETNDKGEVEFKGLPEGTYFMTGNIDGFQLTKASGIALIGNTTKTCNPVFVSIDVLQLMDEARNADQNGQVDLAIEKAKTAVEMAVNLPDTHVLLAFGYSRKGLVDEALASAKRAAEIDPDQFGELVKPIHMEALRTQGNALLAKSDFDGAIAKYNEIVEIAPTEGAVYYNLALAYGHKGDFDKAIKMIDKAIELNPNDLEFKQRKVQLEGLYLKATQKSLELGK